MTEGARREKIAVIGIAGRFPGASNIEDFWQLLLDGADSFLVLSEDELIAAGVTESDLRSPNYVKVASVLDGVELLDAAFFGISPREAEILDPQHRVLLETCHQALQSAGYDGSAGTIRIGLFAGSRANEYVKSNLSTNPSLKRTVGEMPLIVSNDTDYLATGIAYRLNLRGPAVTSVTACSTSLVSLHLACQSLRSGDCDLALAGGVEIPVPMTRGYVYHEGGINSPDGQVRPFDASARGTVFGSGSGVVVLKRLADAIADGDTVSAVILGSAVNNDGAAKSAFSAPSLSGQAEVIEGALRDACIDPGTIGLLEAHGTGTIVGDPIEVAALTQAYRRHTQRTGYCAIASVKGNVGHLGAAAGICGFIKAVLCVSRGFIPASLNFAEPNPAIDFGGSPFYVSTELRKWPSADTGRRAGVSAFGVGGTNAHVIIESPPSRPPSDAPGRRYQLLTLSARTESALQVAAAELSSSLAAGTGELADAAYTLNVGRAPLPARRIVVARDCAEAAAMLADPSSGPPVQTLPSRADRSAAFLFPGQGMQYAGMGRALYGAEPLFAAEMDRCAAVLADSHHIRLLDVLFEDHSDAGAGDGRLDQTEVTQPALFAIEYALARCLRQWGVEPAAMAGHSVGEYVAASLAGVMDPDDALRLVADRGALMQALPAGSMLAVMLAEEMLLPMLSAEVDLAAVNGPGLCVISGSHEDIAAMRDMLARQGIGARQVRTSHAFHSRMMDPVLDAFGERVARVALSPPRRPYVSNVTGTWVSPEDATDPGYWVRQLRCCVRFSDSLRLLTSSGQYVFAEVGPGRSLSSLVRAHAPSAAPSRPAPVAVPTMRTPAEHRDDMAVLLEAAGRLWAAGAPVSWDQFWSGENRRRVPLPGYPYERRRYWIDRDADAGPQIAGADGDAGPFYVPAWREAPLAGTDDVPVLAGRTKWILFTLPGDPLAHELADLLRASRSDVVIAELGGDFASADGRFVLRADDQAGYAALISVVAAGNPDEVRIVHAWTAGSADLAGVTGADGSEADRAGEMLDRGFFSVLAVIQAAARLLPGVPVEVCAVTTGMQDVAGDGSVQPAKAAILGIVKVAAKEFEHIRCRSIDFGAAPAAVAARQLFAETARPGPEMVGYRGRKRWVPSYAAVHPSTLPGIPAVLKDRGVYVITGGYGGLGLVLARQLAELARARLVLVGRTGLPPREQWQDLLASVAAGDPVAEQVRVIQAAEAAGAAVLACAGDVTDREQMRAVRTEAEAAFGPVDGVFHLAAVAGGGMLEARGRDGADAVLRPKVRGTYVLEEVFRPDLFVLYSSTAVVAGDFGLGDYAGANAVMDAFAQARWGHERRVISINWPPWSETGMASQIHGPAVMRDLELGPPRPAAHPLLRSRRGDGADVVAFDLDLDPDLWVYAEHQMNGVPAMPGTGIVELIRAAYEAVTGQPTAEIRDLVFPNLLTAVPGTEARLELRQSPDGGFACTLSGGHPRRPAVQFARGRVYPVDGGPAPRRDLTAQRDEARQDTSPRFLARVGMMTFGSRWNVIRSRCSSGDTDVVELGLPEEFAADTEEFGVHPALLDAAGAMGMTRPGDAPYLPFGYDRIVVRAKMPPACHSVIRHLDDTRGEITRLDLAVVDADGAELVTVEGYSLLRVTDDRVPDAAGAGSRSTPQRVAAPPDDPFISLIRESNAESSVSSAEGSEALRVVLASGLGPQVILCPGGIAERLRRASRLTRAVLIERLNSASAGTGYARSLATAFAPPESEVQRVIAEMWRDAIGVDQVGIDDDFVDLGGDSLVAVQLVGRIAQRFATDVSVAQLFETRTVRSLAAAIKDELAGQPAPASPDAEMSAGQ